MSKRQQTTAGYLEELKAKQTTEAGRRLFIKEDELARFAMPDAEAASAKIAKVLQVARASRGLERLKVAELRVLARESDETCAVLIHLASIARDVICARREVRGLP
jgi:hypothetical protein